MSEIAMRPLEAMPSLINDPFTVECIGTISMYSHKSMFFPFERSFSGSVEFVNNNTAGKQSFKADSMHDLYTQIQAFIQSLQK